MTRSAPGAMSEVFHGLVWPAAAGNVAWAFFTTGATDGWGDRATLPRLVMLAGMAAYLAHDWYFTGLERRALKAHYWIGDALLATVIVLFSLEVERGDGHAAGYLAAVFWVAAVVHATGAWERRGGGGQGLRGRAVLVVINVLGGVAVFALPRPGLLSQDWLMVAAMVAVGAAWFGLRNWAYGRPPAMPV